MTHDTDGGTSPTPHIVGVISDIHANLPALEATLQALDDRGVEAVYCCGDVVGYGPHPNECCELLRQRAIPTVAGNHDHAALGLTSHAYFNDMARQAIEWTRKVLTAENEAFLRSLPMIRTVGDEICLVHASPDAPADWNYVLTMGDARTNFAAFSQKVCFIGHSHQPFVVKILNDALVCPDSRTVSLEPEARAIVNVGSVGQPRDQNSQACCVLYDRVGGEVRFLRCNYDILTTQAALLENDLPYELGMRLNHGW